MCAFFLVKMQAWLFISLPVYLCRNSKPKLCFSVRGLWLRTFLFSIVNSIKGGYWG